MGDASTFCVAAGTDGAGALAERWKLTGVRCLAAASCVALGDTTPISATERSESASWNGTRWKVGPTA